jgi:apolipoprotein N-acyltransferase
MAREQVLPSPGGRAADDHAGMSRRPVRPGFLLALGAAVASAALFFFGTGLHPWWWLTWLAPFPVLLVAPRVRAWPAFATAALAWLLGSLNLWQQARVVGIPTGVVLVMLIVPACVFGLVVLLFRAWVRRGALGRASLAFPTAWVAYELLLSAGSPDGTYPNMGYTQADCLPVLQVASLVGIWGTSYCVFLLPATAGALLSPQGSRGQKMKLAAVVGALLVAVLVYGSWRLADQGGPVQAVTVGLVATDAGNTFPDLFPQDDESALKLFGRYVEELERTVPGGVQVIVLPEKIARVSDDGIQGLDALMAAAAARANATIVVGVDRGSATRRSNEARVYRPDGTIAAVYVKHHLLLPLEGADQPGADIAVVAGPSGLWGVEICKDMDFPALSRRYGAEGVGLLLAPAWDFGQDGWLHSRMAVLRGVESGFTVVRVAKQGLLTVSDDRGRVLAQQDSGAAPFATLVATAPVRHDDTPYLRGGDWFGWANAVGLLVMVGSLWFTRSGGRQPGAGTPPVQPRVGISTV